MTTAAPDPIEACETPIADHMTASAQIAAENQAALDAPARITTTDWNAAVTAAAEHRVDTAPMWASKWGWWCVGVRCHNEARAQSRDDAARAAAEHIVSQILNAARIEVHRG